MRNILHPSRPISTGLTQWKVTQGAIARPCHSLSEPILGTKRVGFQLSSPLGMVFVSIMFAAFPAVLQAGYIGFSVNGNCDAGTCPATALPYDLADTLSVDSTLTLANGDEYLIYGSFTGTNGSGESFSPTHQFEVTYEGNADGQPSEADIITVETYYAFQTMLESTDTSRGLKGAFGSTIAASSSASSCLDVTLSCSGPFSPPSSFNVMLAGFHLTSAGGVFVWDPTYTSNFGAGSAVGSYIVWGQTTELAAPTPEPASFPLLLAGLAGLSIARVIVAWRVSSRSPHPRPELKGTVQEMCVLG